MLRTLSLLVRDGLGGQQITLNNVEQPWLRPASDFEAPPFRGFWFQVWQSRALKALAPGFGTPFTGAGFMAYATTYAVSVVGKWGTSV